METPPRYRVVEKGRQLVVEDRWAGGRPPTPGRRPDAPIERRAPFGRIEQVRFDGGAVLTTSPLYDGRGPRRLILDPVVATWIGRGRLIAMATVMVLVLVAIAASWLLLAIPLLGAGLLRRDAREWIRARATAWLDTLQPAEER